LKCESAEFSAELQNKENKYTSKKGSGLLDCAYKCMISSCIADDNDGSRPLDNAASSICAESDRRIERLLDRSEETTSGANLPGRKTRNPTPKYQIKTKYKRLYSKKVSLGSL
jgi:hypothetical protein